MSKPSKNPNSPTMNQNYEAYTDEDRLVWKTLFERQSKQLPDLASPAFLDGIKAIGFTADTIPNFNETNQVLENITGWNLVAVPGLIDNKPFFELLKDKKFPASTWFRKFEQLDYLEEPDMFHDVYAHVPLLTNQDFCNFLIGLSDIALANIDNELVVELVSRIYWFTVEFGLIQEGDNLRIYGAGILSSSGESVYSVGEKPERAPYNPLDIIRTPYIKDKFQEKYYVIDSYKQLYESMAEIAEAIEQEVKNQGVIA